MLHLPLLNALKTFVVAGNHLNFTKAADELLVSPSAVSHQIRVLEEYLGLKLFVRKNRSLTLTQEGVQLHHDLQGPFDQISKAIQYAVKDRNQGALKIALRPFFSSSWLAQRLSLFWGKHPEIAIDLIHTIKVPDFYRDNIDLGIVWGKGDWPDVDVELLLEGNLTPICSRKLLEEKGLVSTPLDLDRFTLIHDEDHSAWECWLKKAGVPLDTCMKNSHIIDDTNVRVQAILNGQGVMLGCPTLLAPEIESGELVRLFDLSLDSYSYYLVTPKGMATSRAVKTFVDWIISTSDVN